MRAFISLTSAVVRQAARARRRAEAEHKRHIRAQMQAERTAKRAAAQADKEEKQRYIEQRLGEVEDKNAELSDLINELNNILLHTLEIDDTISFDSLRFKEPFHEFTPDETISTPSPKPVANYYIGQVRPPGFFSRLLPGSAIRHAEAVATAKEKYSLALKEYQQKEEQRKKAYEDAYAEYKKEKEEYETKVAERNKEVDELEANYKNGDPNAITAYNTMVIERSDYPESFPQEFRIAYIPESKELVIDYELPTPEIIPKIAEYRYLKTKDIIEEKPRKQSEIKDFYQGVVASISLRTCHEVLEADQYDHIAVVIFNGFVQTVDPPTGRDIRPYLISVRTTKERFKEIDLSRIDKRACLRNLGAQVSPRPYEVQPVKPIVEFDMVDKRFVEQSDILADLESRPNLMDLNPYEFENLVGNLFNQLGLETKLTRSSKDGGVDVVAFDIRPVIGGKVVIQAKRYKNPVGVSAVRDLYGTMLNEGANKGILVTTSVLSHN